MSIIPSGIDPATFRKTVPQSTAPPCAPIVGRYQQEKKNDLDPTNIIIIIIIVVVVVVVYDN
jgi:hypothetical protein